MGSRKLKKWSPAKKRTREHIIADLSENHVEKIFLLKNCAAITPNKDYGCDLSILTFDKNDIVEPESIYCQLKATDKIRILKRKPIATRSFDIRDYNTWMRTLCPVIVFLYDAKKDCAYFQYFQAYFANNKKPGIKAKSVTVRFDLNAPFDESVAQKMIAEKNACLSGLEQFIKRGAI